jgi:hypothetical protein
MKRVTLKEPETRFGAAEPSKDADFEQFWKFYLRVHSRPLTRQLHYIAISIVFVGLAASILLGDHGIIGVICIVIAAGIAGATHVFVEKTHPAAFANPLLALLSGFLMYFLWLGGRLKIELKKVGVD